MPNSSRRSNLPPLQLHVPEPRFRPGYPVDYTYLQIPPAGAQPRPDETCAPVETHPLCLDLVRVLDDAHQAVGPWNPRLDADTLRQMLRTMALTRAFDERMYRGQRQGKTSFYMKCTGEEATSVAPAMALDFEGMVFPSYRQQGILIARGYPLIEMVNQIYSNRGDRLKGRQLPIMYSARAQNFFSISGNLATQYPQAVGWAMASASKGDTRIAATWIGEGSTAEGDFHAALTFGAVYNAPVIFFEPKRIYNGPFDGYYDKPVKPWATHPDSAGQGADGARGQRHDRAGLWHDGSRGDGGLCRKGRGCRNYRLAHAGSARH